MWQTVIVVVDADDDVVDGIASRSISKTSSVSGF